MDEGITETTMATTRRRPSTISMFFLGAVAAYAGMVTADGNGWSPFLFILGGLILGPSLEIMIGQRPVRLRGRLLARFVVLLVISGVSMAVAYGTSFADGPKTFAVVFNEPAGSGVAHLRAWNQWYDGPNEILAFDADETTIALLIRATNGFEEDEAWATLYAESDLTERSHWLRIAIVTPMFDMGRLELRPMNKPRKWQKSESLTSGSMRFTHVIWDSTTRQVIVVRGTT